MDVLKIVAEGVTTSFRYPHFTLGIQPTFDMPPPATIYGHICSAVGEWIDPTGLQFAYHFTAEAKANDLEHIHVVSASSGKLPGTTIPKVLEGNVNPFQRHILFQPRLTLYLNRPELETAFRSPRYAVVLGRSQDLFTYRQVERISLEQRQNVFFEHTLLPYAMATRTPSGVVALMPRFVDYEHDRQPSWGRYVMLMRRTDSERFFQFDGPETYWADPFETISDGSARGLVFHHFVGEDDVPFQ